MKYYQFTPLAFILISACSPTTSSDSPIDKIKKVESGLTTPVYIDGDSTWTIEARMAHYGVPGVSIAVINDSKIAWIKSYGVMDKDSKIPVDSNTLFQAGSISKPVSAYAALKLVAQNKMALDSNINTYLKSWHLPDNEFTKTKKVTLKHLLSHTAGTTVHGFLGYSPDLPVPSLVQVLDGISPANSDAVRVDKAPGESFRYSGGGTSIVQQTMMDIEGKSYPDILYDLVLNPLGMMHSTYDQPLKETILKNAATGYLPDGSMTKGKRHTYPEMAAAGLWTTAQDLARFAIDIQQTYQGKSSKIHTQQMVATMLTPYVEDFNGLGIFINKRKDQIYFGHGGWDEGFSSNLVMHRDKGYGAVILTNSNHPEFIDELTRAVALTYSWDQYVPVYKNTTVSPARIQEISGRYRRGQNALIEVYTDGNKLMRKRLGYELTELIKTSDSTYVIREDVRPIQFKHNPKDSLLELLIFNQQNGKLESTYTRMSANEKIPLEYLALNQFEPALQTYQSLMKLDPKNPDIQEDHINQQGYQLLNSKNAPWGEALFKINTLLYPKSANVYDSYAEALRLTKNYKQSILNYRKSLALNPKNENARKMIKEMEKGE